MDNVLQLDLSKLDSAWGKGSTTARNMMEMMQNQIAFKQMRLMNQDMDSEASKKKLEDARLTQLYAQGLIPTATPGQPQPNAADALARLFTNEQFMANFATLS
jgi:hypothetical protein